VEREKKSVTGENRNERIGYDFFETGELFFLGAFFTRSTEFSTLLKTTMYPTSFAPSLSHLVCFVRAAINFVRPIISRVLFVSVSLMLVE
jgi:hypothetical protein